MELTKVKKTIENLKKIDSDYVTVNIPHIGKFQAKRKMAIDLAEMHRDLIIITEFRKWLKNEMTTRHLSNAKIAERIGISEPTFSQFLTGKIRSSKKIGFVEDFVAKVRGIVNNTNNDFKR